MKFFTATTLAFTVLMFECISIQSEASEIQQLYSDIAYVSSEVCESLEDENVCESIDFYDPLISCIWNSLEGKCFLTEEEDICEFKTGEDTCNESSGCAWVDPESFGRIGEGHCVSYKNVARGSCAYDFEDKLYIVKSKDKCNGIKGCSWHKIDGENKGCRVAPPQPICEHFEDKNECKKSGCGWKNKGNVCGGRWEGKFLNFLVGKDLVQAKAAIRAEYGEAYTVDVKAPQARVAERITLVVDNEGVIIETPLFG